ncbi:5'-nucleotidase /3'-nucleotidase /exopolyphosphatase [Anaerosphaera aminiphila DSM 21120]|uniref:5'-nucleotidase SurE n=1 Tax=Anaerosphaera aminiphila DSM 21120 TaxID=1120995 RepID=A0A1M5SRI0_9FIRM|nr:5'/3'-nucleotidase SurE [Anaerosphaera aminiphila]SHH40563.1 5'-nucleotidase /3'-nucleotidase /exopolyphosphatase [Anaerosphaera aminiphila DSM 21120]
MNILLTNDDGVFAPGIKELGRRLLKEGHHVTIVAPEEENSGKSHAITLMKKLRFSLVDIEDLDCLAYSVSGTPADCVRAALEILGNNFDYCFSGCNLGYNAGMDILYSGTVSAAIEANVFGINSIAVSTEFSRTGPNYRTASKIAVDVFNKLSDKVEKVQVLNVNVPNVDYKDVKGIEVCRIGGSVMDKYTSYKTANGYTLELHGRNHCEHASETDRYFLDEGYATVTPLLYDLTNDQLIKSLKEHI